MVATLCSYIVGFWLVLFQVQARPLGAGYPAWPRRSHGLSVQGDEVAGVVGRGGSIFIKCAIAA